MTQFETIMLVTLGFVVAALIGLFLTRAVWSYALGIGRRRMQRSAPGAMAELQADRDRLRAEYAMLARKLELRLDDLRTRLAEQTAEVSRNRNRIDHLITEIQKREETIAERDQEIAALKEHLGPLEVELANRTQASQQLKETLRERDHEIARLRASLDQVRGEADAGRRQISSLRDEVIGGSSRLPRLDIAAEAASGHDRLEERIASLTALSAQIEEQRRQLNEQLAQFRDQTTTGDGADKPARIVEIKARSKDRRKDGDQAGAANGAERKNGKANAPDSTAKAGKAAAGAGKRRTDKSAAPVSRLFDEGRALDRQLSQAEDETDKLGAELEDLDQTWNAKLKQLGIELDDAKTGSSANGADDKGKRKAAKAGKSTARARKPAGKAAKTKARKTAGAKKAATGKKAASPAASANTDEPTSAHTTGRRGEKATRNVISIAKRIRALKRSNQNKG